VRTKENDRFFPSNPNASSNVLTPSRLASSEWKNANTKEDSIDKYLIELPVSVTVPRDFTAKCKRGKGTKPINKYRTPVVERLVERLENAIDVMKAGKARGMQLVVVKFDSMRSLWASVTQATAMLDALGPLTEASMRDGYCRPIIIDCPIGGGPSINVKQGRHPCVEFTHSGDDFIPNNLSLGDVEDEHESRILLLSGSNMEGKSMLLHQNCLIAVLAQIGCFVPTEACTLTPFDRIFTRLGASDTILLDDWKDKRYVRLGHMECVVG
jgi:DNA mismatch repair protein MSH6